MKSSIFSLNHLLFVLFLAIFSPTAKAQLVIGFSGGLNLANQHNAFVKTNFAPLWKAGANVEYRFFERFSIGYELGYAKKGHQFNKVEFTDTNGEVLSVGTVRDIWNYFDNTSFVKYRFSKTSFRPYCMAGLTLGSLLSGKTKVINGLIEGIDEKVYEQKLDLSAYNRNDLGWLVGLGLEKSLGESGFAFIEARFVQGTANLNKFAAPAPTIKNRNISLCLGYAFLLKAN